ncbi:MAG: 2,3-bisphosphoglycerate-independent phosphoglycerate mutase [Candidatus Paceibacterota bacterium]
MLLNKQQVVLIVLDGWGYREEVKDNAIAKANKPNFDHLWQKYPHSLLEASGQAVGLPAGQMGNSEIGHTTIGAGKVIDTDLVRIEKNITSGDYARNEAFLKLFEHVKKQGSTLHVMGLLSDGGIHSHQDHLYAFLKIAKEVGIQRVAIHAFTDGRDTAPQSAGGYLKALEKVLEEVGIGKIASVSGRFYAMDRDSNWDRLKKVEAAVFDCVGRVCELKKPSAMVGELYNEGLLDEHLEPLVFMDDTGEGYKIEKNDGVFIFNFRSDRMKMFLKNLEEKKSLLNLEVVTMTEYDKLFTASVAFPPYKIKTTLAKEISQAGLTQAHITETEKFPHATYFLNGGVTEPYPQESHIMLDSRKDVPTHDLAPKMRAEAIADKAIEQLEKGVDFIFINFANPDMVGHTANVPAIIKAIETVDKELGRILATAKKTGATLLITADHGNAEINIDQSTGEKHTSHTTNPVPLIITSSDYTLQNGTLADLAPTVLSLLNLNLPTEMTGKVIATKNS